MTAKRCYVYGSTAVDRRLNRKASRRQARLALAHGLEPEPRYPRDREYLD